MLAAVFTASEAGLQDIPRPKPGPGQALLKIRLAGVCRTDLELMAGYHAFSGVPGHEFVATVEEAPDAAHWVGKRVTAGINIGCGGCPPCLGGEPEHCYSRRVIGIMDWGGAFAEYLLAPLANLHSIPESLPDEKAVFAEPMAAALRIAQQVSIKPSDKVLVLGDGKLGLLCALALRHFSARLSLAGHHRDKLALARAAGLETMLCPTEASGTELREEWGRFDLVVEATGSPRALALALALTRPRGTIALKTTSHQEASLYLADIVVNEITIVGSRCGPMAEALQFLAKGRVDPTGLIEKTYPLSDFAAALARAAQPGAGKVLLEP